MKLRFEVDQAACFRKGIDCPKSIVTIEVDPSKLSQKERDLIADRLSGIDVCQLWNDGDGTRKQFVSLTPDQPAKPVRVIAESPDQDGLLVAIRLDQTQVESRQARHRAVALVQATAGLDMEELQKTLVASRQLPKQ